MGDFGNRMGTTTHKRFASTLVQLRSYSTHQDQPGSHRVKFSPPSVRTVGILSIGVIAATLLTVGGTASAAPMGDVHACKNKATGIPRLVGYKTTCRTTETRIVWAQNGPTGQMGARGSDGTNGKDGTNGTNGKDGVNGKDGLRGLRGLPGVGTNGKDGTNGTNGTDGKDGKDGTNGIDGKGLEGPFVLDIGVKRLCKWEGAYKGYPVLKCSLSFPSAPTPTVSPTVTPTPTVSPTVTTSPE